LLGRALYMVKIYRSSDFNNTILKLYNFHLIFTVINHTKQRIMKKVFVLATAALMVVGVAFATAEGNGKKKKCAKGKTCCSKEAGAEKKSCCKDKADKTVKL
jgi:hypothetical protein